MPTYDYLCQECQKEFEVFQRMSDDPLNTCPSCGGTVQRRITGGTGLIFKGAGFYLTDYKGNGNDAATDSGTANGSANGTGTANGDTPKKDTPGSTGSSTAGSGDSSAD